MVPRLLTPPEVNTLASCLILNGIKIFLIKHFNTLEVRKKFATWLIAGLTILRNLCIL